MFTTRVMPYVQWRIEGMAGMARAMGATLTGAQKLLGKNYNFYLQFLEPLFCVPQSLTAIRAGARWLGPPEPGRWAPNNIQYIAFNAYLYKQKPNLF